MATERSKRPHAARSPFGALDLRLGPDGPTGHGELAGVEHLDLLTASPASRVVLRLTRTLRRRFPQLPLAGG